MAYRSYSRRPMKSSPKRWLFMLVPIVIIAGVLYWLLAGGNKAEAPQESTTNQTVSEQTPEVPAYTAPDLLALVEDWEEKQAASYSIVVYDPQAGKVIGQTQPDRVLFAASLYKIYIAYLALMDFQAGTQNPDDVISGSFTKKQCVDKMIRESHSPCGESMMADMGQASLNKRVKELGMTGTFFNGIRTSAQDSALILQKILEKKELNDENTASLLDSMLNQDPKFKRGLATGAPDAKWETKVGWNEDINYHDIGIMTMPDGRKFVVAILGQGSGASAPIADFSKTIYAALAE